MTFRQRLLQWFYPLLMRLQQLSGRQHIWVNKKLTPPLIPLYELTVQLANGRRMPFDQLKGKKILIVNTASDCGYTAQYAELQKLYTHSREDLEIIAFPSNDFKEQEKRNEKEILQFCQKNYGVSFPIAHKSIVLKKAEQDPVFHWLSSESSNGWYNQEPHWNFTKYLVDEEGRLTHVFHPAVSPLDKEIIRAIHQ